MRAGPSAETPREQPSAPDASPRQATMSSLEKLKSEIIALPERTEDLRLPPDAPAAIRNNKEALGQQVNRLYNEVERKIIQALESGSLSQDDAKHMERFLEQKRERLAAQDPYFKESAKESVLGRSINRLRDYYTKTWSKETELESAVSTGTNAAVLTSSFIGISNALAQVPVLSSMPIVGQMAGAVSSPFLMLGLESATNFLKQKGLPGWLSNAIAKGLPAGVLAFFNPAVAGVIGASAVLGAVGNWAWRAASKMKAGKEVAPA